MEGLPFEDCTDKGLIRCCVRVSGRLSVWLCVCVREKDIQRMCVNLCLHSHNSVCMWIYVCARILNVSFEVCACVCGKRVCLHDT